MRRVSITLWLVLLAAPVALAQTEASPTPEQPAPTPALDPALQQQQSTLSGAQMLDQSKEYRKQMDEVSLQIQAQSDKARKDKDIIRLNCLLDKLSQLRVNVSIMDQAIQALQEAISRNDQDAMLHEYTRVTIVNQKAQVLRSEADACIGAETNYIGPTKVEVESPDGLAPGDPSTVETLSPPPSTTAIVVPTSISPWQ
jgi:hypothetical protein